MISTFLRISNYFKTCDTKQTYYENIQEGGPVIIPKNFRAGRHCRETSQLLLFLGGIEAFDPAERLLLYKFTTVYRQIIYTSYVSIDSQ